MLSRRVVALALLCSALSACEQTRAGNSEQRYFFVSGLEGAHLERFRGPTHLRVAEGSTVRLRIVDQGRADAATRISKASTGTEDVAGVVGVEGDVIVLAGRAAGTTRLSFVGGTHEDSVEIVVDRPNAVAFEAACKESNEYWAGLPVVLRYALQRYAPEDTVTAPVRMWGTGSFPIDPSLEGSFWRERSDPLHWVFRTTAEMRQLEVRTTLPPLDEAVTSGMTLELKAPPPVEGIGLLHLESGESVGDLDAVVGEVTGYRAYPVGPQQMPLCNTLAAVRIQTDSSNCRVRALSSGSFAEDVLAEDGRFALERVAPGACELRFTLTGPDEVLALAGPGKVRRTIVAHALRPSGSLWDLDFGKLFGPRVSLWR